MRTTNQKSLIFMIDVVQENSPMQLLLLYLGIFSQNLPHVSNNILQKRELQLKCKNEDQYLRTKKIEQ